MEITRILLRDIDITIGDHDKVEVYRVTDHPGMLYDVVFSGTGYALKLRMSPKVLLRLHTELGSTLMERAIS